MNSCQDLELEQIEEALELFETHDLDKNGVIDRHEFYQLKGDLAKSKDISRFILRHKKRLEKQLDEADTTHDGTLTFAEFLNALDLICTQVGADATPALSKLMPRLTSTYVDSPEPERSTSVDPVEVFKEFAFAETLKETVVRFHDLRRVCGNIEEEAGTFSS